MQVDEGHLVEEFEAIGTVVVHKTQPSNEPVQISSSYVYNMLSFNPNDKHPPPLLIDTRKSSEFDCKFIRNSINLPLDEIEEPLPEHARDLEHLFKKVESKRRFMWRGLHPLVIVTEHGIPDPCVNTSNNNNDNETSEKEINTNSIEKAKQLAHLLTKEKKAKQVYILKEKFLSFFLKYPYRCHGSTIPYSPVLYEILPSMILPWLYLGNAENARKAEQLRVLGIQCVINCAIEAKIKQFGSISYMFLKWVDAPDFELEGLEQVYECIEDIRQNGGKILIHCVEGKSRSASATMYYLMRSKGWSFVKAFDYVKFQRPLVAPNPGFVKQLQAIEEKLTGTKTEIATPQESKTIN